MKKAQKKVWALIVSMILVVIAMSPRTVSAQTITVYSQTNSEWANYPYGYSDTACTQRATISSGGCGILAYVNAVYYLNNSFINPKVLADYSVNNGYRVNGVGTSHGLYKAFADTNGSTYGIKYAGSTTSYTTLKNHLLGGGVAIGSAPGHLMAVVDYDNSTGKYLILDSYASNNRFTYPNGYTWQTESTLENNYKTNFSSFQLISPTSVAPPTNPQISRNQYWYDLGDTIEITAYADGATSYFMSMFKGEERIKGETVSGGKFTMAASDYGIGDYSVYFSCTNSAGTVDTEWLSFSVVGAPGYSDIWTSKPVYSLDDTVSISVSTICAKGQAIGIDKNGVERVVTAQTDSTYTIAASQLGVGQYSAYFSVYNGSGTIDTERVEFVISETGNLEEVLYAEISLNSNNLGLGNTLEVTTSANCQVDYYTIQIWDGSQLVYSEESEENVFSIPCNTIGAGQFTCYVSCTNTLGTVTSEVAEFRIADYLSNPQMVIKNNKLAIEDSLEVTASAEGGVDYYSIQIWNDDQLVHSEIFTGHEYTLPCEELGVGSYSCYVVCTNASGNVETVTESFTIGELSNLQVSINETELNVDDVLLVTTSADGGADYYTIQIWKDDELAYSEQFTGNNFTLACEELGVGEYACYVTAVNNAGILESEVYAFSISEETEDNTAVPKEAGTFSITNASGTVGQAVDVYINLADNPGIVGATLAIEYDTTKLKLVSCEDLGVLNDYQFSDISRNPFLLNWEDALAEENNMENGNIAKLQFEILEELDEEGTELQLSIDTAYDVNIEDVEFSTVNGKVTMKSYTPGDVNEDGTINSKDSILLRKYILGGNVTINLEAADVNRDGNVNSKDSILLRKYILGGNVELK